jgi:hypothetical protein
MTPSDQKETPLKACNCGKVGKEYCPVIDDVAENCDPDQDAIDNGQFGVGA